MAEIGTYSEVGLANLALQMLGRGKFVTALDEDSQAARVMRLQMPYARDAVLRSYPWKFAQARAALPADETAPAFEWAYSYTLPSDCVLMHTIFNGDDLEWRVEGRKVLCNVSAPLYIKYTARVTDLAQSDPLFFQALAARLASDTAVTLTENSGKAQDLWQVYQAKLREARAMDSQEGQAEPMPRGSWHDGRVGHEFPPYNDWRG